MATDPGFKHDRRSTLLAAGRAILAEKGFDATTVSEIVARAGVAQGTFYLYFPSKSALITALNQEKNEYLLKAVREATDEADTAAQVVEKGITIAFAGLAQYHDILSILQSHTMLGPGSEVWRQQLTTYHQLIADLIRQRQTTGEVLPEVNPDIAAKLIEGMINTIACECFIYHPDTDPGPHITELIRFVQRALGIV